MSKIALKEAFEVESKHGAFYTGGNVQWSTDGEHIFCQKYGTVSILSVGKGIVISSLGQNKDNEEEDTINTFTASDDDLHIITHHKSTLFKLWNWKDNKLMKLWKSIHKGPVARIAHSTERNLMASGGSDGTVRLWNLEHHACTHNLKGAQGVISVLVFHPNTDKELVFAAGDDIKIHGWSIKTGAEVVTLSGHFSKVTSLSFLKDEDYVVSSGRDRVLILWNVSSGSSIRVLPIYEEIEDTFIIPKNASLPVPFHNKDSNAVHVAAAGEKGVVRIWEMRTGKEVYVQTNSIVAAAKEAGSLSITHLLYNNASNTFAIITVDHNIIIHSLDTFEHVKQLVGYSDEILDVAYLGEGSSHVAVATNSPDIKLYNISTMNCELLCGHTDIVLSLATARINAYLLVSSAKDNSIRMWLMDKETAKVSCIASSTRHTAPVGSVAVSSSCKFLASVSQDSCLKLWDIPDDIDLNSDINLNAIHTTLAHQKDINCVTISPNDKLIATASQDKTAKLWSADDLQLLGVFRGHRRGVWCVRFSPVDQVLLTTSADCTMKLWSLSELQCLKTLEGHESSTLKAEFLSRGMQIISASGDGLLKLWCIKTSECVCTLEQHESRVWALAVSENERHIISGGSDSLLLIWKDVTEEKKLRAANELEQRALEEQQLANLLEADELAAALSLALKLERPFQVLKIVQTILKKDHLRLEQAIGGLKPLRKEELLKCAITWNANSKNCQVAQVVINSLMVEMEHLELQSKLSSTLESLIPYTERHFARMTSLLQNLHLFTYTLNRMKPHVYKNDPSA
ncbi:transducin beta-like protein 3 [Ceratina calcarata]|uniref:Transducin beta-like protein 3 n=1 Tax=Ceratina calcarata TaxID=156304 RepID=A0AAJ7N7U2_9HYME|nr:transducin beta-like protein 3 [Ceratina calcarata]XP_026670433.1 transducin beta-like protein 3 [Ceratina calcarata]XP_026670434.1 transducin beta-like protein 3 [Ceratina calcarata]